MPEVEVVPNKIFTYTICQVGEITFVCECALTVELGIVFAHRFREVEAYVEVQICITYSFPYANRVLFGKE